jgi:alkaline phosphatase
MFFFAKDHMDYEIDRNPQKQPSLLEMTQKALEVLENETAHSSKGYFIMIEGSRIDMAAHANDPGAHLHDILMYQKVADFVSKFVESRENTVMISVSDHETGGLSVGYQSSSAYPEYVWFPKKLSKIKKSTYMIGKFMHEEDKWNDREFIVKTLFEDWLDISDPTKEEIDFCMNPNHSIADFEYTLGHFVSKRAGLGWSTHGHSGVDVNLVRERSILIASVCIWCRCPQTFWKS